MSGKAQNCIIILLCAVILASVGLTVYTIQADKGAEALNPNAVLVTAPDQDGFEVHPEWTVPVTEPVDYGENLALGKAVRQNGQTQTYNCRNVNDGDRFTYWEGSANNYPNEVTFEMGEPAEMAAFRILLNPRQNWGARTQDVEVQVSDDGEVFTTVMEKTTLSFDPLEDNSVYVVFPEKVTGQYLRFVFHANTGATGGQAAEIEIYGQARA